VLWLWLTFLWENVSKFWNVLVHNVTFRTKMIRQNFILLLCQCQTAALMGLVYKTKKKKTLLPSYIFLLHLIKPQRRHSSVRGRCSRVILLLRHLCHLNSITFSTSPPNHPPPRSTFTKSFFFLLSLQGVPFDLQERHLLRGDQRIYFWPLTNIIIKDPSSFPFCFLFHAELYKGLPSYLSLLSLLFPLTVVTDRLNN